MTGGTGEAPAADAAAAASAAVSADPGAPPAGDGGESDGDGDDGGGGGSAAQSKSAKKRAQKKAAAARKAAAAAAGEGGHVDPAAAPAPAGDGGDSGGEEAAGEGGAGGEGGKKRKKKKKGKGGGAAALLPQTWPEPTVPVAQQFHPGSMPEGEVVQYHHDWNIERFGSAEKRELDRMDSVRLDDLRHSAEVHRQVRRWVQAEVQPGQLLLDVTDRLEAKVRDLIGHDPAAPTLRGHAFPTGCSVNHVAAHWTPNSGDKTVIGTDDLIKFDFGTQVNGHMSDCAWTHCWNKPLFQPIMDAVRAATYEGIRLAGPDARLSEIGAGIQEVMESHEIEIKKKIYQVKSIENLNGHLTTPYRVHAGKSVPIVAGRYEGVKMEEGEVYAIETFGTTSKGAHVFGEGECSHYMLNYERHDKIPIRHKQARALYEFIVKKWSTFAWCRKWLDQLGETKHFAALRELVQLGVVDSYPPLVDVPGSYTAQYEHTIILRPTCKEIITKGEDY